MLNNIKSHQLAPGTVIAVRYPMYKHFAIVSEAYIQNDRGYRPKLISLSYRTGGVQEEPWESVVGNQDIEVSPIQGKLTTEQILSRARSCIGRKIKYHLFTFNCEHFVRYAHGLPVESVQVNQALQGAALGAVSCMLVPNLTITRFAVLTTAGAVTALRKSLDDL